MICLAFVSHQSTTPISRCFLGGDFICSLPAHSVTKNFPGVVERVKLIFIVSSMFPRRSTGTLDALVRGVETYADHLLGDDK